MYVDLLNEWMSSLCPSCVLGVCVVCTDDVPLHAL